MHRTHAYIMQILNIFNIYTVCVYLYIHNKYAQNTCILCKQKGVLYVINRLTALIKVFILSAAGLNLHVSLSDYWPGVKGWLSEELGSVVNLPLWKWRRERLELRPLYPPTTFSLHDLKSLDELQETCWGDVPGDKEGTKHCTRHLTTSSHQETLFIVI